MKQLRISILLLFFLPSSIFNFCISKESLTDSGNGITGRFINSTFLEQIPDSIPGLVATYCFEMNFNSPDSVDIFNGFEEYKLAYKNNGDNYLLVNAVQGKDFSFRLNIDSSILLIDSSWTGNGYNSIFKKTVINPGYNKWVFDQYLNEQMIVGDYTLFENVNLTKKIVRFIPDGRVTGLENYTTYSICYSGDCVGETNPVSNTISFKSSDGGNITYAFNIDKEKSSLRMYNIAPPIKDIKGERTILNLVFDLRKQN